MMSMIGLKVLDLFSGIGGFSLGLERTGGFETVAFCEIDKKARSVLKKHWPDVPIFEDVTTLTGDQINDKIDVIAGGFPCQDISVAGKGAGLAGARSGLWYEYCRLIKEIQPSWAIIENVSALRNRGLDAVLGSLAEIGYDAEWHCIPASAVGAPHRRDRIWIVAYPRHGSWGYIGSFETRQNTQRQRSTDPSTVGGSSKQPALMADAASEGLSQRGQPQQPASHTEAPAGLVSELERRGVITDALRKRLERQWQIASGIGEEHQDVSDACWWAVEPNVGRVANGVSGRVDRLKQLGNAVVPQIPELIGRAILASISEPSR
jgi:DNA (cytosine-5)-methyltransferase 1